MLATFSDAAVTALGLYYKWQTFFFIPLGAMQTCIVPVISFIPLVSSLTFPVFFQAVGASFKSSALTVIRTVFLFVPLGWLFSRFGLNDFWLTFPVTEIITTTVGVIFYRRFLKKQAALHV